MGWPSDCRCTRIWCVRPVIGTQCTCPQVTSLVTARCNGAPHTARAQELPELGLISRLTMLLPPTLASRKNRVAAGLAFTAPAFFLPARAPDSASVASGT